jgi:hypothetical protein
VRRCRRNNRKLLRDQLWAYGRRLRVTSAAFLSKAKSEKIWAKAKDLVQPNGATFSLEAMKIALSEVIKTMLR